MPRHRVRPYGQSITAARAVSALMALALIGMLYQASSDPRTWKWLAAAEDAEVLVDADAAPAPVQGGAAAGPAKAQVPEKLQGLVVEGPNDKDPEEWKRFQKMKELVTDLIELRSREMPVYWQLLGWSHTEPFKKIEERADRTITFAQLLSAPEKYRGKLVRLRMHLRMVIKDPDAPKDNPFGLKETYEAWGVTDNSQTFPYCIVFPDLPRGLRLGPDIRGEVVFVGYFFKLMPYRAGDAPRKAPIMIGRLRMADTVAVVQDDASYTILLVILGVVVAAVCAFVGIRHLLTFRRKPTRSLLPDNLETISIAVDDPPVVT